MKIVEEYVSTVSVWDGTGGMDEQAHKLRLAGSSQVQG